MSRKTTHHHLFSLPHKTKRNLSTLSRKTANILHPSRSQNIVTKRKGQRFSLESQASLAEFLRLLQREPEVQRESDPRLGLHARCPFCKGFVVRNGRVRNCPHQRESWGSFLFEQREHSEAIRDSSGSWAARTLFVPLGRMRSIPSILRSGHGRVGNATSTGKRSIPGILRPGHGRLGKASVRKRGSIPSVLRPGHGRVKKATLRGRVPIPSILRPGNGRLGKLAMHGAVSSSTSPPPRPPHPASSVAYEVSSIVRHTELSATRDQAVLKPNALMQQWNKWSQGWEQSVATINVKATLTDKGAVSVSTSPPSRPPRPASTAAYEVSRVVQRTGHVLVDGRPPLKPNAVMQQWSEWSEGWEQSVGTINADSIPGFVSSADEAVDESCCRIADKPRVSLGLDTNGGAESQKVVDLECREQPRRNPDTLMQDWKEWSEGWQRRVKSR